MGRLKYEPPRLVNDHPDLAVAGSQLRLAAVTTVANRIKAAAILDHDRRKIIAALVVTDILPDFRLAQFAQLLTIDVH